MASDSVPAQDRTRILFVTASLSIGGAELGLLHLIEALDRSRYELKLCSLVSGGALASRFRQIDVTVHELGVGRGIAELRALRLLAVIARFRPHVIHGRLILPALWARLGRLFGARVISEELGMANDRPAVVTWVNRATQPLSDVTVTNARAVAERVIARDRVPASRVRVIPSGLDLSGFAPRAPGGSAAYDLITVARLEHYKGVFDLLDVAEQVRSRRPNATLAIVGAGSQRETLERQIDARGLSRNVLLLGERSDVADLLRRARVFVSASHEEGLSHALVEAMAAGLPVVCTDVGGSREVVSPGITGTLVPPHQTGALAEAALGYLERPELGEQHGRAGRALALERFEVRRMVREFEAMYDSLRDGTADQIRGRS